MAREKTYEISKDLESIVKGTNSIDSLLNAAKVNPKTDNIQLREAAANMLQNPFLRTAEPTLFVRQVETRKQSLYETLTDKLNDETYGQAISFYTAKLDENVKYGMYVELLKEGIVPEKPSDKLKEAIARIEIAEGIERALDSEDVDTAIGLAAQYLRPSQERDLDDYMVTASNYGMLGKKNVLRDVAKIQKLMAGAQIAKENLYSEIDSAVEKAEYGKAKTFVKAYNAYKTQERINDEKAKAEKKGR